MIDGVLKPTGIGQSGSEVMLPPEMLHPKTFEWLLAKGHYPQLRIDLMQI